MKLTGRNNLPSQFPVLRNACVGERGIKTRHSISTDLSGCANEWSDGKRTVLLTSRRRILKGVYNYLNGIGYRIDVNKGLLRKPEAFSMIYLRPLRREKRPSNTCLIMRNGSFSSVLSLRPTDCITSFLTPPGKVNITRYLSDFTVNLTAL